MEDEDKQVLIAPTTYTADVPPPYTKPTPTGVPGNVSTVSATVVTQPVIVHQHNVILGKVPVIAVCPVGRHEVTTQIHYENGNTVWLIAILLCFFLGPLIAWIPFLIDDLKDVVHTCPIDGTVIGVHHNKDMF